MCYGAMLALALALRVFYPCSFEHVKVSRLAHCTACYDYRDNQSGSTTCLTLLV